MRSTMMGMAALACLVSQAAPAQPDPGRASQTGPGIRNAPIRIESSLAIQLPLAAGASVEDQVKQTEAGRKAIYGMAARECTALVEVFKTECRLTSLRANSNVQARGNGPEQLFVSGAASYELFERPN